MATTKIANVRVAGISSVVPALERVVYPESANARQKLAARITGVRTIRVAQNGICTSDLCCAAARHLLTALDWASNSVDSLIFVTQTPDYVLPGTSASLQHRLGLSTDCAAFDLNLGCSGYIYGLWLGSLTVSSGGIRRLLLLVGDTLTRIRSPQDRVTEVFGDAGTATALEYSEKVEPIYLELGTDGAGLEHLCVPAGGFRQPRSAGTSIPQLGKSGNIRSQEDIYMNSLAVFAFAASRIPPLVRSLLKRSGWANEDVAAYVFTQPSLFTLQTLGDRINIPHEKLAVGLQDYGSTSSASIPLTITTQLNERLRAKSSRLILAGFGAGYSWGAAALHCGPMCLPELLQYPSNEQSVIIDKSTCNTMLPTSF
jgi:3-oxoacyl-[acyl-carrier-protein] synthase III